MSRTNRQQGGHGAGVTVLASSNPVQRAAAAKDAAVLLEVAADHMEAQRDQLLQFMAGGLAQGAWPPAMCEELHACLAHHNLALPQQPSPNG